ncbi:MAG: OmcA/MtrC family decaheme c-type cytochrome [Myxococcota bacterium]
MWAAVCAAAICGCGGSDGEQGPRGEPGEPGPAGDAGAPGRSPTLAGQGLSLEISEVSIEEGTATATFSVTSGDDQPLDIEGVFSPGEVSINFVIARLARDGEGTIDGFTTYTTQTETSSDDPDVTVEQPSAESDGTFVELGPGLYEYTFSTEVIPPDESATHRVAAYATRNFEDVQYVANEVFDFVPSGGDPEVWEPVTEAACNDCHGQIEAHGGSRQDLGLCVSCHTMDAVDAETGNSIDFKSMLHKIHMGEQLPSVREGEPYQISGYRESIHDYSEVVFPSPIGQCSTCHEGEDALVYREEPDTQACLSCHDNIVTQSSDLDGAAEWVALHPGGEREEGSCDDCHTPTAPPGAGPPAVDWAIENVHTPPLLSENVPDVSLTILDITNTAPGDAPVLDFQVEVGGEPHDILSSPLASLRAVISGPNTSYQHLIEGTIQDSFGVGGTLTEIDAAAGEFRYEFADNIPADATGSYTVAMEALLEVEVREGDIYDPENGQRQATTTEVSALNPTLAFAVTDPEPVPRRTVVGEANCNDCHTALQAHGGRRRSPDYCVSCHMPSNTNADRAARLEGEEILVESVDFKVMIHKIHAGENLTQSYVLGGYPPPSEDNPLGNPIDFGHVKYPRELAECQACHEGQTYELPMADTIEPSLLEVRSCSEDPDADTNDFCNDWTQIEEIALQPERAVCTSCHDAPSTDAHAQIMTTETGDESCATCHGPGSSYGVSAVHGLMP